MIDRQVRQRTGSDWRREELGMSDKGGGGKSAAREKQAGGGREARGRERQSGDGLSKALGATAAFAAAYGTRKLVTLVWKRITGKEPPSDPNDPQVSIGEALTWAAVLGVSMETARLLAGRAATKNMRRSDGGAP
jgi:Protein of unknown function (DUF4235)